MIALRDHATRHPRLAKGTQQECPDHQQRGANAQPGCGLAGEAAQASGKTASQQHRHQRGGVAPGDPQQIGVERRRNDVARKPAIQRCGSPQEEQDERDHDRPHAPQDGRAAWYP